VFAFLVAARFAALVVSLPPYQFARDVVSGLEGSVGVGFEHGRRVVNET
jgi:hypothetical protein